MKKPSVTATESRARIKMKTIIKKNNNNALPGFFSSTYWFSFFIPHRRNVFQYPIFYRTMLE